MDALIRVMRKEKGFILVFGILQVIKLFFGITLPLNAFLTFIGCFTIVTIAHDEYNSIGEKITCVFLTVLPLLSTYFVGVEGALVFSNVYAAILSGFFIRGIKFFMRKLYS